MNSKHEDTRPSEATFRDWFKANLSEKARDIANHGADAGFPHITYTSDCVELFDRYGDDIWEMAVHMADDCGNKNVAEMISGFTGSDMLSLNQFKNLMVWFACETLAQDLENERAIK